MTAVLVDNHGSNLWEHTYDSRTPEDLRTNFQIQRRGTNDSTRRCEDKIRIRIRNIRIVQHHLYNRRVPQGELNFSFSSPCGTRVHVCQHCLVLIMSGSILVPRSQKNSSKHHHDRTRAIGESDEHSPIVAIQIHYSFRHSFQSARQKSRKMTVQLNPRLA